MIVNLLEHNLIKKASELGSHEYTEILYESDEVFSNKIRLFPRGCLGYLINKELAAYIISFPWSSDLVPINELISLVKNPRCYYIHDLAISKKYQNNGIGKLLANEAIKIGEELCFPQTTLVAVQDSDQFWKKLGFSIEEKIIYYGCNGYKMIRENKYVKTE